MVSDEALAQQAEKLRSGSETNKTGPSTRHARKVAGADDSRLLDKWRYFLFDHEDKRLSRAHLAVLGYLYDQFMAKHNYTAPRLAEIIERTGLHKSTVTICLNELEGWRYIRRERSNGGRNQRTKYFDLLTLAEKRHAAQKLSGSTRHNPTETVGSGPTQSDEKLSGSTRHASTYYQNEAIRKSEPLERAERATAVDPFLNFDGSEEGRGVVPEATTTSETELEPTQSGDPWEGYDTWDPWECNPPVETWQEWFLYQVFTDPDGNIDPDQESPYNLTKLGEELGFEPGTGPDDTIWNSYEKFRKTVEGTAFPGSKRAIARLRKWLEIENAKSAT